jgi:hypothetical protein
MNNIIFHTIFFLLFAAGRLQAQEKPASKTEWNGYTQLRFSSDLDTVNTFALRRMKLWVQSAPGFSENWGYRVQSTITSNQNEKFFLQDVLVYYKTGRFTFNIGQFIPRYSLQRFQPDFEIPLTERTAAIDALIPNGTLGVRDIGTEVKYTSQNKNIQTWVGVFNGYGIKDYRFDNQGILLSHKTDFRLFNTPLNTGYSVMYRKADDLQVKSVLPDSVLFSGNDLRYNLFAHYQSQQFEIQAEYLWACLDKKFARGYYILAALTLGKHQFVSSWNRYNDLISSTEDVPVIQLAYNYLLNHDKLKIMWDNGWKIKNGKMKDYFTTLQLQLFFK